MFLCTLKDLWLGSISYGGNKLMSIFCPRFLTNFWCIIILVRDPIFSLTGGLCFAALWKRKLRLEGEIEDTVAACGHNNDSRVSTFLLPLLWISSVLGLLFYCTWIAVQTPHSTVLFFGRSFSTDFFLPILCWCENVSWCVVMGGCGFPVFLHFWASSIILRICESLSWPSFRCLAL
jgi:hypothetical protein